MKDFSQLKIVGCLMVHTSRYLKRVVEDLLKYTDELYVNLNEPSQENRRFIINHPKVKKFIETKNENGRWIQSYQRYLTIEMLNDVKPDLVLFPDDDEIFYNNLPKLLEEFWKSDKKAFTFTMDYYWDNEHQIRREGRFGKMHHIRVLKWEPNLIYHPYAGFACPTNLFKLILYHKDAFVKHLGYLTEEDRQEKFTRDHKKHYISRPLTLEKERTFLLN